MVGGNPMDKKTLKRAKYNKSEVRSAFLFLAPSLIAFIAFVVIPLIMVIGISFTKYNVLKPAQWNDYKNWIVLSKDKRFWNSLLVAGKFTVLIVPMHIFSNRLSRPSAIFILPDASSTKQ